MLKNALQVPCVFTFYSIGCNSLDSILMLSDVVVGTCTYSVQVETKETEKLIPSELLLS